MTCEELQQLCIAPATSSPGQFHHVAADDLLNQDWQDCWFSVASAVRTVQAATVAAAAQHEALFPHAQASCDPGQDCAVDVQLLVEGATPECLLEPHWAKYLNWTVDSI